MATSDSIFLCNRKNMFTRKLLIKTMKQIFFTLVLASFLLTSCTSGKSISIYTIGDSTMAQKQENKRPETGWAEKLYLYLDKSAKVYDHGLNGRSSKSFINEGEWKKVFDALKKGDYVLIQFGHNDEKSEDSTRYTNPHTTYKDNLRKFINETRSKMANPILLTSISRRSFNDKGVLTNSHGEYPQAARELAKETGTPLIDAQLLTEKLLIQYGPEGSKKLFLHVEPGPNYPEGKKDDTHLNDFGANMIAKLIADEIKNLDIPLSKKIK